MSNPSLTNFFTVGHDNYAILEQKINISCNERIQRNPRNRFCLGELWRRQDTTRLRLSKTAEVEGIERHTRRQFGASCHRGRSDSSDTQFQL